MDDNKICPKCHMPLEKKGSGSLTQWIKVCNCGRPEPEKAVGEPIKICTTCGKRIEGGRAGTLTQWIFRADLCTCEAPTWVKNQLDAAADAPLETFEAEELEELPMEPGSFPVERYGPIRRIGMGASGTVYLCRDRLLKKKVAVKVLNNLSSEQLVAFQREAKATSQIVHPNIVKVLDFGVSGGKLPYMVLEFIDGLSLQEILEQRHSLSVEEAIPIFNQICDALTFAHNRHLFHRDLKPTNIIVVGWETENIDVRIIDFGVGVINKQEKTEQGKSVAGSPPYMAPDQALGRSFDERSEIYCLGCVMFEVLTGRPPFIGDTALQTISLHAHAEPPSLSEAHGSFIFPESIESVIETCLKKSQDERFKDMVELKHALSEASEHVVEDRRQDAAYITPKSIPKHTWVVLLVVLLAGTIGGAFLVGQLFNQTEPEVKSSKKQTYQEPKLSDALDSMQNGTWYKGSNTEGQLVWTSRPNLYDKDMKLLTKEQDVKRIAVGITDNITGMGFKHFLDRGILSVMVQSTGLTDEGLAEISKMKTIEDLRISLCSNLSSEGIKSITTLPKLDNLNMTFMKVPDGAFAEISKITTLESIALYNAKNIKVSDIELLAKLPHLEYLDLSSSNLNNDVIPVLLKFPALNNLRLGNLDLTDKNLELLCKIPHLTDLGLAQNPRITDDGLAKIAKCKRLETLVLDHCDGISPIAIKKFLKGHRNVTLQTISDTSVELENSMEPLSGE